jgi:hypothetical protein
MLLRLQILLPFLSPRRLAAFATVQSVDWTHCPESLSQLNRSGSTTSVRPSTNSQNPSLHTGNIAHALTLILVSQSIYSGFNLSRPTAMVQADFSKAFDTVWSEASNLSFWSLAFPPYLVILIPFQTPLSYDQSLHNRESWAPTWCPARLHSSSDHYLSSPL